MVEDFAIWCANPLQVRTIESYFANQGYTYLLGQSIPRENFNRKRRFLINRNKKAMWWGIYRDPSDIDAEHFLLNLHLYMDTLPDEDPIIDAYMI